MWRAQILRGATKGYARYTSKSASRYNHSHQNLRSNGGTSFECRRQLSSQQKHRATTHQHLVRRLLATVCSWSLFLGRLGAVYWSIQMKSVVSADATGCSGGCNYTKGYWSARLSPQPPPCFEGYLEMVLLESPLKRFLRSFHDVEDGRSSLLEICATLCQDAPLPTLGHQRVDKLAIRVDW